jgi:hypothetical protein
MHAFNEAISSTLMCSRGETAVDELPDFVYITNTPLFLARFKEPLLARAVCKIYRVASRGYQCQI